MSKYHNTCEVSCEFSFDSAHYLPNVPEHHQCKRLHGHTYTLRVYIAGEPDKLTGWVTDFGEVKHRVGLILNHVDHFVLNNIKGLENPTCENITHWLWLKLETILPGLSEIVLYEGKSNFVRYRK